MVSERPFRSDTGEGMMENILVLLIVGLAAIYVIRRLWKGAKEDAICACGCACSNNDSACTADKLVKPDILGDRTEK